MRGVQEEKDRGGVETPPIRDHVAYNGGVGNRACFMRSTFDLMYAAAAMASETGHDDDEASEDRLKIALQHPPSVPGDIIQSALHLPLTSLSTAHIGRKVRIVAQAVHFDPASGLAILASPRAGASAGRARPVLLVDLSVALLGQSPAAVDVSDASGSAWSTGHTGAAGHAGASGLARGDRGGRAMVSIEKGEWMCVVGWLERDERGLPTGVDLGDGPCQSLGMIMGAIHISAAREPPSGAIFRGNIECWDGSTRRAQG